jgi:hypothetical protein
MSAGLQALSGSGCARGSARSFHFFQNADAPQLTHCAIELLL